MPSQPNNAQSSSIPHPYDEYALRSTSQLHPHRKLADGLHNIPVASKEEAIGIFGFDWSTPEVVAFIRDHESHRLIVRDEYGGNSEPLHLAGITPAIEYSIITGRPLPQTRPGRDDEERDLITGRPLPQPLLEK
jgi:hypothetical protein